MSAYPGLTIDTTPEGRREPVATYWTEGRGSVDLVAAGGWCAPGRPERVQWLHVLDAITDLVPGWSDHEAYDRDRAWLRKVLAPALEGRLASVAHAALVSSVRSSFRR